MLHAQTSHIPRGDAGIEATLRRMRREVERAVHDPLVIEWAHDVVRSVTPRDKDGEAEAFLNWVRDHSRYTNDPVTAELLKTPAVMVREVRAKGKVVGDCDDLVTWLAAGLTIIGLPVEFVVVGEHDPRSEYTHVLLTYESPVRGPVSLDPITPHAAGWFPPSAARVARLGGTGTMVPMAANGVQGGDRRMDMMNGAGERALETLRRDPAAPWILRSVITFAALFLLVHFDKGRK